MIQIKYDDNNEAYLKREVEEALGPYFGKFSNLFEKTGFQSLCELANEVCEKEKGQRWAYLKDLFEVFEKLKFINREEKVGMATGIFSAISQQLPEESYGAIKPAVNPPGSREGEIKRGRKVVKIFSFI